MQVKKMISGGILIGSLIGLVMSACYIQTLPVLDDQRSFSEFKILKYTGFGSFLSSTIWPYCLIEMADAFLDNSQNPNLLGDFETVIELDPNWAYPILVAAWSLPDIKGYGSHDVVPLLEEGAERFPDQWKFRLTWAQYILAEKGLASVQARDSVIKVLLPLSNQKAVIPNYVRVLVFTMMQKNGQASDAVSMLMRQGKMIDDGFLRSQYVDKIIDLLEREGIQLGDYQPWFSRYLLEVIESGDEDQFELTVNLLQDLLTPSSQNLAIANVKRIAQLFRKEKG